MNYEKLIDRLLSEKGRSLETRREVAQVLSALQADARDAALLDWAETHPVAAMEALIGWWETAGPGCREIRFEFRNILNAAMSPRT